MPFDPVSYIMGKQAGGGGGDITVESLSVTENGTKTAPSGKAYSPVVVAVPNSYSASDEGKVVSNGALVAQTEHAEVTQNGTVDTTLNNSVTVNVQEPTYPTPIKDVVFVDYDGEIVQEYTAQEFAALSALPANPSHTGLTAQGWNWTLADAKDYVSKWGCLVIGQNYITNDEATKINLELNEMIYGKTIALKFYLISNSSITVNWGDGNSDTLTTTNAGNKSVTHSYEEYGNYTISISCNSGNYSLGDGTISGYFISGIGAGGVVSAHIGKTLYYIHANAFSQCANMSKVSVPTGITTFTANRPTYGGFASGGRCKCVVFPSGTAEIGPSGGITDFISLPKSVTSVSGVGGNFLRAATLPEGAAQTGYGLNLRRAERVSIPGMPASLGGGSNNTTYMTAWYNRVLKIPSQVTSITKSGLAYCSNLLELHMLPETPPTLGDTTLDIASNGIIYVPYSADHSILEAYQTATNWSTFASKMQEEPQ